MRVYKYNSYDHYVESQNIVNKKKLGWVYVRQNIIKEIARDKQSANNILCHGTRNGAEQVYFQNIFK